MSSDEQKPDAVPEKTEAAEAASALPGTSPSPEPPDIRKEIRQRIYRRFGLPGLVILSLLGGVVWTWWNWDDIGKRPGIQPTLAWFSGLPQADPDRFTVVLARLENDDDRQYENLIFEGLNEQFDSQEKNAVQILRFDRTIERRGADPEASVNDAHQEARAYLEESGADVLIWGSVLVGGDESIPKLYWTPSRDVDRARDWGRYPTEGLELRAVFWTDLVEILQLLVVTHDAEFWSLEGHFVAARLGPFVEKVRTLLTSRGEGWSEETRARVRRVLAGSLSTLGAQAGTNQPLEEAIVSYRETLKHYTRERAPLQWATTQNNLGSVLRKLGERESETEGLEQAVTAYREALKERTRERVPLQWAMTQYNLGNSRRILGQREKEVALVCEALGSHLASWTLLIDTDATRYTLGAEQGVTNDLQSLKNHFAPAEYETCIEKHRELLDSFRSSRNQ